MNTLKNKKVEIVTTPAYYINGPPHLGHYYSNLLASSIARERSFKLLSGSDVHGRKMRIFFENKGISQHFERELPKLIFPFKRNISSCLTRDYIFRYTEQSDHIVFVRKCGDILYRKGYIFEDFYRGFYIKDEERFSKREESGSEEISSGEYFLDLKQCRKKVLEFYKNGSIEIGPASFQPKIFEFVESIDSLCISRKEIGAIRTPKIGKISGRSIHVWFDALLYYLSGVENPLDFEGELHQVIGKDILLFHSGYGPAILIALGLKFKLKLYITGWIIDSEGEKLSKSRIAEKPSLKLKLPSCKSFVLDKLLLENTLGKDLIISKNLLEKTSSEVKNLQNLISRVFSLLIKKNIKFLPFVQNKGRTKERGLNKLIHLTSPGKGRRRKLLSFIGSGTVRIIFENHLLDSYRPCIVKTNTGGNLSYYLILAKARG